MTTNNNFQDLSTKDENTMKNDIDIETFFEELGTEDLNSEENNNSIESKNKEDKRTVEEIEKEMEAKRRVEEMKKELQATQLEDPNFGEKLYSLSDSLEVVNSLGFGDSGNIVLNKNPEIEGKLIATSQIVGYRVKNIGSKVIKYYTDEWSIVNNVYVGKRVEKELKPGKNVDLTRKYMTILCARPEISFKLSNGTIIRSSASKTGKTIEEELESYYFKFSKGADGVQKQVNDDTVKLNVGEKKGDKWFVKPEFEKTFGFLNKNTNSRTGRNGIDTRVLTANYVNRLIADMDKDL